MRGAVAHYMTRHAARLEMAMLLKQRLVRAGVGRVEPLLVLRRVAACAGLGTHVIAVLARWIIGKERRHGRLDGLSAADAVVEAGQSETRGRVVRNGIGQPEVVEARAADSTTVVEGDPSSAD